MLLPGKRLLAGMADDGTSSHYTDAHGTEASAEYRYGFQGQEQDDEVKGKGNSVNYKYRMHDPRIGRFFAVDPLAPKYPHYTPYQFSGNKVIDHIELEGLEESKPKQNGPKSRVLNTITSIGMYHLDYGAIEGASQSAASSAHQGSSGMGTIGSQVASGTTKSAAQVQNISAVVVRPSAGQQYMKQQRDLKRNPFTRNLPKSSGGLPSTPVRMPDGSLMKLNPQGAMIANRVMTGDIDAVSIDLSGDFFLGGGAELTIHSNWIVRGPHASWKPTLTVEQTLGAGYSIGAGVGMSGYVKTSGFMKPTDFATEVGPWTTMLDDENSSYQLSTSFNALGRFGLNGGFTPDPEYGGLHGIYNLGFTFGVSASPGFNGTAGFSNSRILWNWNDTEKYNNWSTYELPRTPFQRGEMRYRH